MYRYINQRGIINSFALRLKLHDETKDPNSNTYYIFITIN